MQRPMAANDLIDAQSQLTTKDLEALSMGSSGESGLRLTGLEVLGFIAVKAVIPIITGFVSREAWERWNKIRTKKEAARAEAELAGEPLTSPQVEPRMMVDSAILALVDEGIPRERAEELADSIYERVSAAVTHTSDR